MFRLQRVYEDAGPDDGTRILIDRLWPRGVSKERAALDAWRKDLAPSDGLRRRFHADGDWDGFEAEYRAELSELEDALDEVRAAARDGTVTLLFSARDLERNHAHVLKAVLEQER